MKRFRLLFAVLLVAVFSVACNGGGDVQAFCDSQAMLEDLDPSDAEAADRVGELADEAPEEIAEDVQTVADALEAVNAGEQPDDPEGIQQAAENVQDWVDENCEEG